MTVGYLKLLPHQHPISWLKPQQRTAGGCPVAPAKVVGLPCRYDGLIAPAEAMALGHAGGHAAIGEAGDDGAAAHLLGEKRKARGSHPPIAPT